MGIYVGLRRTFAGEISLRQLALSRLNHCIEAIKFFREGAIFAPENVEIWKGFPAKALGGTLLETTDATDVFVVGKYLQESVTKRLSFEDLFQTIIVFNGVWSLNGIDLAGFFSIHNSRRLRNIYRDIEIDAYGKKDVEDLVDALWKMPEKSEIISSFIKSLKKVSGKWPSSISELYLSRGVPVTGELDNIMAVHFLNYPSIIWFLYKALEKDADRSIASKVEPIRDRFFVRTLVQEEVVKSRFEESIQKALIEERIGDSFTYIAKEQNSFSELYKEFVNKVFRPAFKNLPIDEKVKGEILRGLRGEATIGDFEETH